MASNKDTDTCSHSARFFFPYFISAYELTHLYFAATPRRDHVFYVTTPDHWKHPNIQQQFSKYGNVHSAWLSPSICYVALHNREHAPIVMKTIQLCEGVTIQTFTDYQAKRNNARSTPSVPPPPNPYATAAAATTTPATVGHVRRAPQF